MDVQKKTLNIDRDRLRHARRILGAPTDTSAIHMALDCVVEGQAIVDDIMAVAGKGAGLFRTHRREKRRR